MTTRAEYYGSTSREFLARAESYLTRDDLLQASEKGWGAVALKIKSVAETRDWRHRSHSNLSGIIDRLAAETRDRQLKALYGKAGEIHRNFYEGRIPRRRVRYILSQIAELLQKLDNLPV